MKGQKIIPVFEPDFGKKEIESVSQVLKSGWIGLGPKTAEFEKGFADYVDCKYAIALSSATAALHLALIAADIKKGDEVIVPSLTFVSTAHVVLYLGAKPVFADIEEDTLCLSPKDAANKITKKTKAIIPVHYGGHPCNMDEFKKLAKKYNLTIIEDAAHACGSSYKGKKIGSISSFTCFSFHAVKNLSTGDGGMITTKDKDVADRLMRLRWLGINKSTWGRIGEVVGSTGEKNRGYGWYYEIDELGYKYHMNDIAAALGLVQLAKLEKANEKRRQLAERYTTKLSNISGIKCPIVKKGVITSQHNYVIRSNSRDELYLYLLKKNISSGVHYLPIHMHPFYRKICPKVHLPVTESVWSSLLTLPLYPHMTKNDQDYIINSIREYSRKK